MMILIKYAVIMWFSIPSKQEVKEYIYESNIVKPSIVYKQCILESGHLQSYNAIVRNNLFGMRHSSQISVNNPMGYFIYDNWKESVDHYKRNISVRHRIGESYYEFLKRIGYAEAKNYIELLKQIK